MSSLITHHTILLTIHLLSYLTFAQCSKRKSQPYFSTTVVRPQSSGQTFSLLYKHSRPNSLEVRSFVIHCHEALDELAKHNTAHIEWIAVHVGHWGNERADELAKIGTTRTILVKGYIPQSHIKALINHKFHLLNQVKWTKNGHCHTNTMLGNKQKHTIKTLNEQLINNIIHYRTALQIITGHIGLNKHLYNMIITNTTKCPACD